MKIFRIFPLTLVWHFGQWIMDCQLFEGWKADLTQTPLKKLTHTWCSENVSNLMELLLLFSCSVMSNNVRAQGLQHARLPCPSPSPGICQTHVHWVSDAVQPSHPLSSPSPPAFSLSQHQGLFQWISSSHQVVKIWELQHQSFQWILTVDFL